MTSPVLTREVSGAHGSGNMLMSFVMPSQFRMTTIPKPTADAVSLEELPEKMFAVHTFSGWALEKDMQEKKQALRSMLERDGLFHVVTAADGTDSWMQARYDPPWVPAERRTNEVMLEVRRSAKM
eukprot:gnl/TRDRNA2_/TRDRNA2_93067_c1_seq1.p1 gnl/TRDRNA2_/TRDRNA2_93067_c1~~gnl/TRDRNA2_/TRDRNA2_93067_c1_seq1.p1  ORF type:complete len:125 (-),score=22.82 gnl/TRDRNA2_/TRDRNA2_93067_c1_seq1:88-462(-)